MLTPFLFNQGFDTPPGLSFSSRPEHKAVIKPIIAHEQITGKLFIIEIGLCELRQVVTFLYNPVGEIFFIIILPLILVPEIPNKVVRIFLAQIMVFVVAPHEKGFLFGVAQLFHRIPQGEEVPGNPALLSEIKFSGIFS